MKNTLVVIVLLALLGVGGYFYLSSRGMMPKAPVGTGGAQSGGNVFTSIKDALSKSLSLKCVYKDENGVETTTYIKGGAVRVMMQSGGDPNQPNNIIMKDMRMHMWSDASKTGFVYTLEKSGTDETTSGQANNEQQESVLAQIEKYKDACKTEIIADSMFSVPTDVNFQDMQALQEQMMQGLPQGQ
ncbi:MAG: hypothetical protein US40_C0007G0043 [Candidatus Roizmanbacteria bacterium GW2011_GWC2_37_13]|uniref:Uncharacterized protein n=1 Tax=Candidatus Roizmanbacteria bacterium GW2011_GWC2_37_13 TaxID=1618486 RepID=A0A0G0IMW5_9BACT|nr:MAG: hypothetical protein US38_C0012G0046 [Candidatus Roizmanbacteria bacterium GW2011_GWC1_37_12]KKQ25544.1 MAG: hypothetical protein US40_C0007G0043 [Candidatus Roizmanbacteria bacterium GW2011_GWC2_37_13]